MGGWDYEIATGAFHNHDETIDLFGLPREAASMTRAELEAIIHPDDLPRQRAEFDRACASGTRYDVSFRIDTATGEYVVNAVGEAVRDRGGKVIGLVGIVQDITERDRVQRELEEARKSAEAASEAKSRFLATMGHELRTPLNAINGFSELMAQEALGPLGNASYREYCEHIHASGCHLLDVINSILDATRLEVGRVEVAKDLLELSPLVHSVIGQMAPAAADAGVALLYECADDVIVTADPRLLRQVLFNLVGNAVKFSPGGSAVEVSGCIEGNGSCVLRVSDAGPGIPEADRERVMQPFQQIDDGLSRRHDGVGLGLYIVRQIVEAHGATMEIGTSDAGGAEVTIVFPADTELLAP
jgi:PAS domain S-box-containing protein